MARVQRALFAEDGHTKARALDKSVQFLSAPGESLEAVEIARLILDEAARGVRFQEMAVLLRTPSTYASHLASAFDRAGISAFFLDGVPRVDPAARALGLLLDLAGADLDRAQVAEFLTTARIPYQKILGEDARISPARWDRISARAGIVSGIDQWRTGLRAARESAEEREFDDEVALIDSLELIVERLHRQLAELSGNGLVARVPGSDTRAPVQLDRSQPADKGAPRASDRPAGSIRTNPYAGAVPCPGARADCLAGLP